MDQRSEKRILILNKGLIVFFCAMSVCLGASELFAGEVVGNATTSGLESFQGGTSRGSSNAVASFSNHSTGSDNLGSRVQSNPNMLRYNANVNMRSTFTGFGSRPSRASKSGQMGEYAGGISRRSNSIPAQSRTTSKLAPSTSFRPVRQASNAFTFNLENLGKPLSLISTPGQSKGLSKPSVLGYGSSFQTDINFQKQAVTAYNAFTKNSFSFGQEEGSTGLFPLGSSSSNISSQTQLGFDRVNQDAKTRSKGRFALENPISGFGSR